MLYYASRHIPSSLYPVEYEFRRVYTGLMCEYGGFQTAARQRNGGRFGLYTPCVGEWTDWRDENEQQASKK